MRLNVTHSNCILTIFLSLAATFYLPESQKKCDKKVFLLFPKFEKGESDKMSSKGT